MTRVVLIVLALTAVCHGILPEIVHSDFIHILEDNSAAGQPELDRFVEVEQLPEDPQQKPEDAFHERTNESVSIPHANNLLPSRHNETASDKVIDNEYVHTSIEPETNNISTSVHSGDLGNNIEHGCISDGDCMKGSYCLHDTRISRCLPCKAIDVSCTKDTECCSEQLCVWGQCNLNATKGEAGSTCQQQTDCSPDLCCLFHKALLFPVCSSKPIERERCFGASNHLSELMSWDIKDQGPMKHCPCAGDLHCEHLGRGSMCLKGEDSSEEDLTDSLYSDIDYII
ncbi:Dickkopf-related protein 3 [Liparis tanakae]|uniref:Dickkopf-related protein 3 n=1 Tax=Liparis tanakae TaxID=230148 RepID=A0A4Z2JCU5_9TELE|nr:Dickkopf-related protein 3 [Liparis tanakae]